MAFALILGLESVHCRPQDHRWLIQKPRCSETLTLYRFAKAVLEYTTIPIARSADHNVAQTDIMLWTWRTAADADHQTDSDVGKAV